MIIAVSLVAQAVLRFSVCRIFPETMQEVIGAEYFNEICTAWFFDDGPEGAGAEPQPRPPLAIEGTTEHGVNHSIADQGPAKEARRLDGEIEGQWYTADDDWKHCDVACHAVWGNWIYGQCSNRRGAEVTCANDGLSLARIEWSGQDLDLVHSVDGRCVWTGLYWGNGEWVWDTNEFDYSQPTLDGNDYQNWAADPGDGKYVYLGGTSCFDYKWLILFVVLAHVVPYLIYLAICFTFACMYYQGVTQKRGRWEDAVRPATDESCRYNRDLCGCLDDLNTCCTACWCHATRVGDTHAAMGFSFCCVFAMFFLAEIFALLLGGAIGVFVGNLNSGLEVLISAFIMAFYLGEKRGRLQAKLRLQDPGLCCNIIIWMFCGVCAATQEAKFVDAHQKVMVQCCCDIQRDTSASPAQPVVMGQPVAVPVGQPTAGVVVVPAEEIHGNQA